MSVAELQERILTSASHMTWCDPESNEVDSQLKDSRADLFFSEESRAAFRGRAPPPAQTLNPPPPAGTRLGPLPHERDAFLRGKCRFSSEEDEAVSLFIAVAVHLAGSRGSWNYQQSLPHFLQSTVLRKWTHTQSVYTSYRLFIPPLIQRHSPPLLRPANQRGAKDKEESERGMRDREHERERAFSILA